MTMEAATILPHYEGFESSAWKLSEPLNAFDPLFNYGITQVVRSNVSKWKARLRYVSMGTDQRQWLARFIAHVGTHRPFWVRDPSLTLRGSFPATELLSSPYSASFWTPGTNRSVVADNEGVRVTRTGATQNSTLALASSVAVTANANYAFRAVFEKGPGTLQLGMAAGSTATGTGYGSSANSATAGRRTLRVVPTATPMYVSHTDDVVPDANWTQPAWYLLRAQSLVRAFTVDGGTSPVTQTGNGVYVKDLPTSTTDNLDAGDMVEIVSAGFSQMVRVTEAVASDSSGKGYMMFEPYLRGAVSDNDLIIPYRPMCLMRLTEEPDWVTRPGHYSDVELACEEYFG